MKISYSWKVFLGAMMLFKVASFLWYIYVITMMLSLAPEAASDIEDAFILLFVTSVALVLPEVFRGEE